MLSVALIRNYKNKKMNLSIMLTNSKLENLLVDSVDKIRSLSALEESIRNHSAINHKLFSYIRDIPGLTPNQYSVYRANYFYRTLHTIPSIACLLASAALNCDFETLSFTGQNLYEETGCGKTARMHNVLLELSHNYHGKYIFGIKPLALNTVSSSLEVMDETKSFVKIERSLYQNENYAVILGAAYAHETAAVSMLTNFYEGIFDKYRGYYDNLEFYKIMEYFLIHITGIEQDHAYKSHLVVKSHAKKDKRALSDIICGAISFLDAQSKLWDGIYNQLVIYEDSNEVIPFKPLR